MRMSPRQNTRLKQGVCVLCDRTTFLTFHHLIPRKVHRRPRFRKTFSKAELEQGINICQLCHRGIHRLHDEMRLAQQLNTLDRLREDPAMQNHIAWVAKQKRGRLEG